MNTPRQNQLLEQYPTVHSALMDLAQQCEEEGCWFACLIIAPPPSQNDNEQPVFKALLNQNLLDAAKGKYRPPSDLEQRAEGLPPLVEKTDQVADEEFRAIYPGVNEKIGTLLDECSRHQCEYVLFAGGASARATGEHISQFMCSTDDDYGRDALTYILCENINSPDSLYRPEP